MDCLPVHHPPRRNLTALTPEGRILDITTVQTKHKVLIQEEENKKIIVWYALHETRGILGSNCWNKYHLPTQRGNHAQERCTGEEAATTVRHELYCTLRRRRREHEPPPTDWTPPILHPVLRPNQTGNRCSMSMALLCVCSRVFARRSRTHQWNCGRWCS